MLTLLIVEFDWFIFLDLGGRSELLSFYIELYLLKFALFPVWVLLKFNFETIFSTGHMMVFENGIVGSIVLNCFLSKLDCDSLTSLIKVLTWYFEFFLLSLTLPEKLSLLFMLFLVRLSAKLSLLVFLFFLNLSFDDDLWLCLDVAGWIMLFFMLPDPSTLNLYYFNTSILLSEISLRASDFIFYFCFMCVLCDFI